MLTRLFPSQFRLRTLNVILIAAAVTGSLALSQPAARGQAAAGAKSFTWDTVDPSYSDFRTLATQKALKDAVLLGQQGLSSNRTAVENWYLKYTFPLMSSPDHLGEIPQLRDSLAKDLRHAKSTTHQFLVDLVYKEATKRVVGNYHPAVRYNAMLIVASLNQVEARVVGTDRYPAVRLPQAFDFMLDQLKQPDQLDVLRLGAMIGIRRHIRLVRQRPADQPLPDAKKAEVAALMETLLNEKTPPANRNESAHTWMRRRAIDVLAAVGAVGENLSTLNSLVSIVGDATEPLSLRCEAALALEQLDYTNVTGVDAIAAAQTLGGLAAYACRAEDERVKEEQKKEESTGTSIPGYGGGPPGMFGGGLPGMDGGGYPGLEDGGGYPGMEDGGGYPGMEGGSGYPGMGEGPRAATPEDKPIDYKIQHSRIRMKFPLYCVLQALRGTPPKTIRLPGTTAPQGPQLLGVGQMAADAQQKAEIQKIIDAVDALIVATDTFDDGLEEMMKEVRVKTRELEAMLPKSETEPAAEETPAGTALPGAALPGAALPGAALPGADDSAGKKANGK